MKSPAKPTIKGIIFDMDNTLLRSSIDFHSMKRDTYHYLVESQFLPPDWNLDQHTTSTIITEAISTNKMGPEHLRKMWDIAKKYEVDGMRGAKLEKGVVDFLNEIRGVYNLAVVTNNAVEAAETALRDNDILPYFDLVVGRERMNRVKPSPDGFLYVLQQFKKTTPQEWISVGDAWIDGKASIAAGIPFVAYNGDSDKMKQHGVVPCGEISDIRELKRFL
ncbi:HAD family hydrolase [Paenibacillus sp. 1011MAR3C5]|uniref:HAD family hydrolase n=1 Tax=Paenibacillus sp. 1011MAR3C5 TaxID=1675787 RepID=UPI000E6CDF39|nr:HAD-IA family hydrolase [Paenibacillus sp. 1011MAR3C5]RJE90264.1 HAD family hydrolase [Paenibacillus sp. 1011MAR3C5]